MSTTLLLSLISLTVSVVCIILLFILFKNSRFLTARNHTLDNTILELNQKLSNLGEELHEIRSGNYGVANRFKELVQQVQSLQSAQQKLQSTQENLVEQDPQSRFYSKGAKLISQGASLEEVISECDMPAAEAELLFSLHNSQK